MVIYVGDRICTVYGHVTYGYIELCVCVWERERQRQRQRETQRINIRASCFIHPEAWPWISRAALMLKHSHSVLEGFKSSEEALMGDGIRFRFQDELMVFIWEFDISAWWLRRWPCPPRCPITSKIWRGWNPKALAKEVESVHGRYSWSHTPCMDRKDSWAC